MIRPGELVAFDTDLIGPYSYCADISRTYFCGPGRPSDDQRRSTSSPGSRSTPTSRCSSRASSYRELAETVLADAGQSCKGQRYSVVVHGVGLCDEYPPATTPRTGRATATTACSRRA